MAGGDVPLAQTSSQIHMFGKQFHTTGFLIDSVIVVGSFNRMFEIILDERRKKGHVHATCAGEGKTGEFR
jgi:hypothetical protein